MKEELSIPLGHVVGVGAVAVRADVAAQKPTLPIADGGVAVLEVHQAGPERLDLGAPEHQAGLDRLENLVLVPGATVGCDRAIAGRLSGLTWHVCMVIWTRFLV